MDIICKCVSFDPVDRPSMTEVLRAFNSYIDVKNYIVPAPDISRKITTLGESWNEIALELESRRTSAGYYLEKLVEQRMDEIQLMMKLLSHDVVNLIDTRERLILSLISLFQQLGPGDRFLSITTPRLWQGAALGLDGRYFTATELATSRGASIQRFFIFSVQEVGGEWASILVANLEKLNENGHNSRAGRLANDLKSLVNEYNAKVQQGKARDLDKRVQDSARERFSLIIKSYLNSSEGMCRDLFDTSKEFSNSSSCNGMHIGLIPMCTLNDVQTCKSAHPISVFYYGSARDEDKYLLMMTNCLGRNSFAGGEKSTVDDIDFHLYRPELKSITVFKSVLGVPEDRIKKIEQLARQSINIGGWTDDLYGCLPTSF